MVTQLKYLKTGDKFQIGSSDVIKTFYEKELIEGTVFYKWIEPNEHLNFSSNGELEVSAL